MTMNTGNTATAIAPDLSPDDVECYLTAHPEFFEQRPQLLSNLRLPHGPRGAVSLVERQIHVLRGQIEATEDKLLELVDIARENERLSTQLHAYTLALMDAENLDGVLAAARDQLIQSFKTEFVKIGLFDCAIDDALHEVDRHVTTQLLGGLLKGKKPYCGQLAEAQRHLLFGELAEQIKSVALIPLAPQGTLGFLALGSTLEERFRAGMGTIFLSYLGELLTHAILQQRR